MDFNVERLVIGFYPKNINNPATLSVVRSEGQNLTHINTFTGVEAEALYSTLIFKEDTTIFKEGTTNVAGDETQTKSVLNAYDQYLVDFAKNHNLTIEQAKEQPMVKARLKVFQDVGW